MIHEEADGASQRGGVKGVELAEALDALTHRNQFPDTHLDALINVDGTTCAVDRPVDMGVDSPHATSDKFWFSHATYVRTCTIPAGDIAPTDFDLSPAQQIRLPDSGKVTGGSFRRTWKPSEHVNRNRRKLTRVGTAPCGVETPPAAPPSAPSAGTPASGTQTGAAS